MIRIYKGNRYKVDKVNFDEGKEQQILMNDTKNYKAKINSVYVDFYTKNLGFLSTFENTLDGTFDDGFERDLRALKRIIKDVYSI